MQETPIMLKSSNQASRRPNWIYETKIFTTVVMKSVSIHKKAFNFEKLLVGKMFEWNL